jgi:hypothetical protein
MGYVIWIQNAFDFVLQLEPKEYTSKSSAVNHKLTPNSNQIW